MPVEEKILTTANWLGSFSSSIHTHLYNVFTSAFPQVAQLKCKIPGPRYSHTAQKNGFANRPHRHSMEGQTAEMFFQLFSGLKSLLHAQRVGAVAQVAFQGPPHPRLRRPTTRLLAQGMTRRGAYG